MKLDLADIFVELIKGFFQPFHFDAVISRRNVERRGTPSGGKNLNVGAMATMDSLKSDQNIPAVMQLLPVSNGIFSLFSDRNMTNRCQISHRKEI